LEKDPKKRIQWDELLDNELFREFGIPRLKMPEQTHLKESILATATKGGTLE
jgi:hypothetical protein